MWNEIKWQTKGEWGREQDRGRCSCGDMIRDHGRHEIKVW